MPNFWSLLQSRHCTAWSRRFRSQVQAVLAQTGARHGDIVAGVGGGLQVPAPPPGSRAGTPSGIPPGESHGGTAVSCPARRGRPRPRAAAAGAAPTHRSLGVPRQPHLLVAPALGSGGLEITRVARRGDACVPHSKKQSVGDDSAGGAGIYIAPHRCAQSQASSAATSPE